MPVGTRLYATGTGEVIIADDFCVGAGACNNRAGNYVAILHPDGTYSRYLHMDTVSVTVGQDVVAGDLLGTNGVTGHNSSPHLHYDEQQPLGSRIDFGTFIACVDGEVIEYPAAFGTDDWNQVEYGSLLVNEGFDCHTESNPDTADPETGPAPRILAGPNEFAVTAPLGDATAIYEISVSVDGGAAVNERVSATEILRFDTDESGAAVRGRLIIDGDAQPWSPTLDYEPTPNSTEATCNGLYASQTSLDGTPQADVIIGTPGSDVINGNGGNDILCGGERPDSEFSASILGGNGRDTINGGDGDDILIGGAGRDILNGGQGVDSYDGGDSFDQCVSDSADEDVVSCEFG